MPTPVPTSALRSLSGSNLGYAVCQTNQVGMPDYQRRARFASAHKLAKLLAEHGFSVPEEAKQATSCPFVGS